MNPKESTVQKTLTIGPHPHQPLANAILHLANAITQSDCITGSRSRTDAARDLVRDIAFPDHARKPSPAHAPSCDAPHCACAEGEDCHANRVADPVQVVVGMDLNKGGLAATAWTLNRVDCTNVGDVLRLSDGHAVIQYMIPAGTSYDDMKDALHALSDRLHGRKPTPPPAADLAARIDGLKAAVDALARTMKPGTMFLKGSTADLGPFIRAVQEAKAADQDATVMIRAVAPAYPGPDVDRDTWALDPDATGHRAPFSPGDLVVRLSGRAGIHQVVEVSVDGDAPRHRSLCLKVEPTDVIVDADAF